MVEFRGLDQLVGKLKRNADLGLVKKAVKLNGAELDKRMKRNATFKGHYNSKGEFVSPTGETKRTIETALSDGGFTTTTKPTTHYSYYLEKGTRFMSSQPFVRPSYSVQKKIFIQDMQRLMK